MRLKFLYPISLGFLFSACLPLFGSDWRRCQISASARLVSVVYGNDTFVAVGDSILYSTDTVRWDVSPDSGNQVLKEVIFAEGRFFAAGRGGEPAQARILISTDGIYWSTALVPDLPGIELRSLAYRENVWVAAGDNGTVLRSEDGNTWNVIAAVSEGDLTAVVATDAGFAAFADGWIYETVNGADWSSRRVEAGVVDQVVFAAGRFFGRYENNIVWSSLDGLARLHLPVPLEGIGHVGDLFTGKGDYSLWLSRDLGDSGFTPAPLISLGSRPAFAASEEKIVVVGDYESIRVRDSLWAPVVTVPPTTDRNYYALGSNLSLEVNAVGSGEIAYQWRKNGSALLGETGPRLIIEGLTMGHGGGYSVTLTNESGTGWSGDAYVRIAPATALAAAYMQWSHGAVTYLPAPDTLAFGNGRFVGVSGVAAPASIMHSRDGLRWRSGAMPALRGWAVTRSFAGGKFFLGGMTVSDGKTALVYSPDGFAWARAHLPEGLAGPVFSVAWGNGSYVAVSPNASLWSENGVEWQKVSTPPQSINAVAFGQGVFLGIASNAIFRSEDGRNWVFHADLPLYSQKLSFEGGRWWLMAGGETLHSPDGINWQEVDQSWDGLAGLVFANDVFLAAGRNGAVYSGDGTDWGRDSLPMTISALAQGNGRIVAVTASVAAVRSVDFFPLVTVQPTLIGSGSYSVGARLLLTVGASGTGELHYQWRKDGVDLPEQTGMELAIEGLTVEDEGGYSVRVSNAAGTALSRSVEVVITEAQQEKPPETLLPTSIAGFSISIAYGNGRFVAVSLQGIILHSRDGIHWSGGESYTVRPVSRVLFRDGKFVIGGVTFKDGKPVVMVSTDGIVWAAAFVPADGYGPIHTLAYGDGIFLGGGVGGVFWSEDAVNWQLSDGSPNLTSGIAFGNGFFLGVRADKLYRSSDGRDWVVHQTLPVPSGSVSFAGDRWWLRHERGLFQSLDALEWVEAGLGDTDVLYAEELFLAIDFDGLRFVSENGFDWGADSSAYPIRGIAEGGGRVVGLTGTDIFVRNAGYAPVITLQPKLVGERWAGESLNLEVRVAGGPGLRYQWFRDAEALAGANGPVLHIENLDTEDSGAYHVLVVNGSGAVSSEAITVDVGAAPPVISLPWQMGDGGAGSDVAFGNGLFVSIDGTNLLQDSTLQYSRDGITWRGGKVLQSVLTGGACFGDGKFVAGGQRRGGTEPLILYSNDGAAWSAATLPAGMEGTVRTVAWGDGLFVASGGKGVYSAGGGDWLLSSEDGVTWERVAELTVSIESIAYGEGFFLGATVNGTVFKSVDGREWVTHGQTFSGSSSFSVRLRFYEGRFYLAAGPYQNLWHSADGATWVRSGDASFDVVASNLLLAFGYGRSIYYGATDGAQWVRKSLPRSVVGAARGGDRIVAVGGEGAIVRKARIEPHVGHISLHLAQGVATFRAFPIGEPPLTFSWYRDDEWVTDSDEPTMTLTDVSTEDEGEYRVRVTNASGSTWSNPLTFLLVTPPSIVSQPTTIFANPGETASFTVWASGSRPMNFQWRKADEVLAQNDGPSFSIENATATDAGEYVVMIENAAGAVTSGPMELRVILNYEDWVDWTVAEGLGNPDDLNPGADPTGSGVPNLLRYMFNLPLADNSRDGLPRLELETDPEDSSQKFLLFSFHRRKEAQDVMLSIETSQELGLWTRVDMSTAELLVEDAGAVEIVTLRHPLGDGETEPIRFFRLVAEEQN